MPQPSYAYGVARVRVLENKLLTRDKVERMVDAPSSDDALKILAETDYGVGIAELTDPGEYEKLLNNEAEKSHEFITTISPDPEITDLFFLKYDMHNLKVLFKARLLETEAEELLLRSGTIPMAVLKEAVQDKNYLHLPAFLKVILEELENTLSIKTDPQAVDLILDRGMYQEIMRVCKTKKNTFVINYFAQQIDLVNLESFLRVKKMEEGVDFLKEILIPEGNMKISFFIQAIEESLEQLMVKLAYSDYGKVVSQGIDSFLKNGNITEFEKLADEYLLSFVKAAKRNPFGIEPIIGYLLAKENEANLIRIVMVGKMNNIPTEKIRKRLRDVYV